MTRSMTLIAALAGACLVGLDPAASHAATLFVEGNSGAMVEVDGEALGRLPWQDARELGAGPHRLRVSLVGHRDYEIELGVSGPDDTAFIRAQLLPLDRNIAAVSSLMLAGLGQHYEGRPLWGWGLMIAQLASATVAFVAEDQFKGHRADFRRAQDAYDAAISESVLLEQRAIMESSWADMEDAETIRDVALYGVIGLAVASAVEAWWTVGRALDTRVEMSTVQDERQLRLGLGGRF